MVIKKACCGDLYDYDDKRKLYYNPPTNKWVQRIRPSVKGQNKGKYISKVENSKHHYYDFKLSHLNYSPEKTERINFFLSKVERKYQPLRWFNINDDNIQKIDKETIVYFSSRELNYLLTVKTRDEIINDLVGNDLIAIKKQEKKSHFIDGRTICFTKPKILWFFSPTKKLLARKKEIKTISYKRVNNSVNNYYGYIEKKLGYYADYYRRMYTCKFNISRKEFDQIIEEKYQNKKLARINEGKQMKCTHDEYLKSANFLYESIMEWNCGDKYSNLSSFKIDAFSGRVHSIFSMLAIDFYKYNDTFNFEIDLKTSQPVILAHLLRQEIGDNKFSNDVDNGIDIYEKIKTHYSLNTRAEGKQMFYELIFGSKTNLEELYPQANAWVKEKKNFEIKDYWRQKDTLEYDIMAFYVKKKKWIRRHSIIALMLQKKELDIFRKIWNALHTVGIDFVTRHDSVVINLKDADNALYHINNILEDELSVNYKLHSKKI